MADKLVLPMAPGSYQVTSGYGQRGSEFHRGIDYAAPKGTPFYCAADGTVSAAGTATGFGQWIVVDHIIDGAKWSTVYGHMYPAGVFVHAGEIVKQGEHIGDVGANGQSTGPHLHFETWKGGRLTGGQAVNPDTVTGSFAGSVGGSIENPETETSIKNPLDAFSFLTEGETWMRVLLFIAGLALVGVTAWELVK